MKFDQTALKNILLRENYVTTEDLAQAEKFARSHHADITDYLLSEGLLTKDLLGQAMAEAGGVPYADLNSNQPSAHQVLKIDEAVAKRYRLVLFAEDESTVTVTTDTPWREQLAAELAEIFSPKKVIIMYSLPEDIDTCLLIYRKPIANRWQNIITKQQRVAPEIISEILADAVAWRSSDVHFEPQENEVIVRFRIDGVLREIGRLPKTLYPNMVNLIKVQAQLRTDEHFSAQDGAIRFRHDSKVIDIRVAIVPTLDGEKMALRLLSQYIAESALDDLGLSPRDQTIFSQTTQKPFGMIIVTGPTGSGKTTTLYTLLKRLNRESVNIMTIEDPVEYKIVGVNQIQVNLQTNLTFAKGLRSIARQDPDIILVGEIRDEETAEIAINAALTGHLVMSTFHATDAATAIPRLLDMKIEPFLLASTLELLVAQRLVRKICANCRYSYTATVRELEKTLPTARNYFSASTTLYRGKGCDQCNQIGYLGQTAIFELLPVTPALQELILHRPTIQQIMRLARQQHLPTLFDDGIEKVKNGITTLAEIKRVAPATQLM